MKCKEALCGCRAKIPVLAAVVACLAMGVTSSSLAFESPASRHFALPLRAGQSRELIASAVHVHQSSATAARVLRIRGGSAAYMRPVSAHKVGQPQSRISDRETLKSHKARLKAERPRLMDEGPSGGGEPREKPTMLSLVNPSARNAENHGEVKEVEKASSKSFKAFQGTGNVMLTADQIKTASSSQMHRLALARLARLQQNTAATREEDVDVQEPTEAEDAEFQGEMLRRHRRRVSES